MIPAAVIKKTTLFGGFLVAPNLGLEPRTP